MPYPSSKARFSLSSKDSGSCLSPGPLPGCALCCPTLRRWAALLSHTVSDTTACSQGYGGEGPSQKPGRLVPFPQPSSMALQHHQHCWKWPKCLRQRVTSKLQPLWPARWGRARRAGRTCPHPQASHATQATPRSPPHTLCCLHPKTKTTLLSTQLA